MLATSLDRLILSGANIIMFEKKCFEQYTNSAVKHGDCSAYAIMHWCLTLFHVRIVASNR